jgi:O-antigen biosynthesis protein WbqV
LLAEGGLTFKPPVPQGVDLALIVGAGDDTSLFIQALRRSQKRPCLPVGILDPSGREVGLTLRDVPVLGTCNDLRRVVLQLAARGRNPRYLVIAERLGGNVLQALVAEGESLGLEVRLIPSPTELQVADSQGIELKPIQLTDLLGRPQTVLDRRALDKLIEGRRVLVTGAGGTIGSELSRQIAALRPSELILLDSSEFNLYEIDLTLRETHPSVRRVPLLCNVRERERVMQVFDEFRPELVFHAAALKHVPMVELNPGEGVLTNVIGSRNVADAAFRSNVLAMVQVSTDKVVNPTSVMGATKRMAELYCQALDIKGRDTPKAPRFMTVRFGNVLGSSGSLIPLFERQLKRGGPLTVTHPEIKRYFMTVREAVELVLQASAHGIDNKENIGQIFVLDMGEPIKIIDIARQMIKLAGKEPERDIKIEITGLRPGEKLFEELFDASETRLAASVPGILRAAPKPVTLERLQEVCTSLFGAAGEGDAQRLRELLASVLLGYKAWDEPPTPDTQPVSIQRARERRAAGASGAIRAAQ